MQTQPTTPVYSLAHITDLAMLDDVALAQFAIELPTLVAFLKLTKNACESEGKSIKDVLPVVRFALDQKDEVTLSCNGDSVAMPGLTYSGSKIRAAMTRHLSQLRELWRS
jgi:hypothetical protein